MTLVPRTASRAVLGAVLALGTLLALATPAIACGGLVGENGTIRLSRTSTLAAFHDGVEHYVTSFEFTGEGEQVGSIIPLPGKPTDVVKAGDWTLQRLGLEVHPPRFAAEDKAASATAGGATVVLQTKVDALDITILEGGGTAVGQWATDHGFLLTPDAPEILDSYAARSPYFMAARFDAQAARARGQQVGDGTPIQLTIPTDRPWVPLRILTLGQDPSTPVQADVFLLTDQRPQLLAGRRGTSIQRSEQASTALLTDLRSDQRSDWVPSSAWFTYLAVDGTAGDLQYDLATSVDPTKAPSFIDAGVAPPAPLTPVRPLPAPTDLSSWPVVVVLSGAALITLMTHRARQQWRMGRP